MHKVAPRLCPSATVMMLSSCVLRAQGEICCHAYPKSAIATGRPRSESPDNVNRRFCCTIFEFPEYSQLFQIIIVWGKEIQKYNIFSCGFANSAHFSRYLAFMAEANQPRLSCLPNQYQFLAFAPEIL
jgi:hypothetical protein